MKLPIGIIVIFLLLHLRADAQRKAVFIILDGISADALERAGTPALDEIAETGGYTRAMTGGAKDGYSESPTISAVGYNHLLTGTWSHKHNVWDNDVVDPNYHYWNIFRIAKNHDPSLSTAIFSSWLDNRTKLAGDGLADAGNISIDFAFDGLELDTAQYPHRADRKHMFDIDEAVSKKAAETILEQGPDLSWVYLEFTDDMGHLYGDSPEYVDAIKKADAQVARIWKSLLQREEKFGEEWLIVVTTDHGRDSGTGKNHGGQSERERTVWIVSNVQTNEHFPDASTVDIMPSILAFMNIPIPDEIKMELDGISFLGPVSVAKLSGRLFNRKLHLSWEVLDRTGECQIFMATTNNFSTGIADTYEHVGSCKVANGQAVIEPLPNSNLYKVVIKAQKNWATVWVVNEK